jgi:hypothetical protein
MVWQERRYDVDSHPNPAAPAHPGGDEPGRAEVAEVWPRDGQIRLVGSVPSGPVDARAALVARLRGRDQAELRVQTMIKDGRFDARLAVPALARACTTAQQTWDLYLALPDHDEELRLGRHLDDIRGKKKIFTYPAQATGPIHVKPYFTIKDNLSITCSPTTA